MTINTKEWIQYSTAIAMVVSGIILAFLSFFLGGYDIAEGVLWYVAQSLTYAGGIFGVALYLKSKCGELESEARDYIEKRIKEEKDNTEQKPENT